MGRLRGHGRCQTLLSHRAGNNGPKHRRASNSDGHQLEQQQTASLDRHRHCDALELTYQEP